MNRNCAGREVDVGPRDTQGFSETEARGEHEPRELGKVVPAGQVAPVEQRKPRPHLLDRERPGSPVTIHLQGGQIPHRVDPRTPRRTSQPQIPDSTERLNFAVA